MASAAGNRAFFRRFIQIFEKPHLLGLVVNVIVILVVSGILINSLWSETRGHKNLLADTDATAKAIFAPNGSLRGRTVQINAFKEEMDRNWPLIIKGSDEKKQAAIRTKSGPIWDKYSWLDARWDSLHKTLESGISSEEAIYQVNQSAREWAALNIFYQARYALLTIWCSLAVIYALFVYFVVIPRADRSGRTESLLLVIDVGLYFAILSWFTRPEIAGLTLVIVVPVALVFFEVLKTLRQRNGGGSDVVVALTLFLFFLFFGFLQLRAEYGGAPYSYGLILDTLREFLMYAFIGGVGGLMLTALFYFSARNDGATVAAGSAGGA